jgi:hypothetical protein
VTLRFRTPTTLIPPPTTTATTIIISTFSRLPPCALTQALPPLPLLYLPYFAFTLPICCHIIKSLASASTQRVRTSTRLVDSSEPLGWPAPYIWGAAIRLSKPLLTRTSEPKHGACLSRPFHNSQYSAWFWHLSLSTSSPFQSYIPTHSPPPHPHTTNSPPVSYPSSYYLHPTHDTDANSTVGVLTCRYP